MRGLSRRGRPWWMAAGVAASLVLAACSSNNKPSAGATSKAPPASPSPTVAANTVSLRAGLNDPKNRTIAILEYLPQSITVTVGTTVQWQIAGPEPHSVTFFPNNGAAPPPGSNTALYQPTPPTSTYDGTTLANSGLIPQGPPPATPFSMSFSKPGSYVYHCVIHAQMTGTVNVVATGTTQTVDTQDAITARGTTELNQYEAEGEDAAQQLAATAPKETRNADGTSTWTIEMGKSTAHTDVLAFSPITATVKPKDKVVFDNESAAPHTATFPGSGQLPQDPTSVTATAAAPGKSPQTLSATGFFNTGTLPPNAPPGSGPPLAAREYTYVVPASGTYNYACIFHVQSGMTGSITAQ